MSYKTPRYNIFTAKLKKSAISGHGNETKNLSPVRSQTLTSTQLKNIWSAAVWTAPAEDIGRVQTGSQETRPNSFPNHMTTDTPSPSQRWIHPHGILHRKQITSLLTKTAARQRLSFGLTHYTGSRPRQKDKNNIQERQHSWQQINMYCVLKNPWNRKTWTRAGLISFLKNK